MDSSLKGNVRHFAVQSKPPAMHGPRLFMQRPRMHGQACQAGAHLAETPGKAMPHRRPAAHGGARMEGEPPAGACVDAIHRQATGLTGLPGLPHRPRRLTSSVAPPEAGLRCLTAFGPAGLVRRHGAPEGPASFEPGRCPVQAPLQKQIFHDLDRETGSIAQLARPASKIRPEAGTPRRMQNAAIQPAGASFRSRYSP